MIAVFHGKDDFSAHEALSALTRDLDSDGMLADNTIAVEGARARPDELLAICQTAPFLGAHRLVVVWGLLERFGTPARGRRRRTPLPELGPWQTFVDGLGELPESTALVFFAGELDPKNRLLQALRPLAQVREFKPLKQGELAGWIAQRAERSGAALEGRAIAALAGLVGNQLGTLESEIQKLAVYAGDRQVSEEDVRSLVSLAREPNAFAMADATIEGRAREALDLLQRLLAEGDSPQRLLGLVTRQYRLLLLTKELLERGTRPPEIAGQLRVQGFVIQRILRQAPAYNLERLRRAYRRLLQADLSVKRGVYDDETALELLLFELAMLARASPGGSTRPGGRRGYSRPRTGPGPARSGAATA